MRSGGDLTGGVSFGKIIIVVEHRRGVVITTIGTCRSQRFSRVSHAPLLETELHNQRVASGRLVPLVVRRGGEVRREDGRVREFRFI